jgi:hypothetical protein
MNNQHERSGGNECDSQRPRCTKNQCVAIGRCLGYDLVTDKHNTTDAFVNNHLLTKALLQFPADGSANKISSATRYALVQKSNDASDSQMPPSRWMG